MVVTEEYKAKPKFELIKNYFQFEEDNYLAYDTSKANPNEIGGNIDEEDLDSIRNTQAEAIKAIGHEFGRVKSLYNEINVSLSEKQTYDLLYIIAAIRVDISRPNKNHIQAEIENWNNDNKYRKSKTKQKIIALSEFFNLSKQPEPENIDVALKNIIEYCFNLSESLEIKISIKSKGVEPNKVVIKKEDDIFKMLMEYAGSIKPSVIKKEKQVKKDRVPEWNRYRRGIANGLEKFFQSEIKITTSSKLYASIGFSLALSGLELSEEEYNEKSADRVTKKIKDSKGIIKKVKGGVETYSSWLIPRVKTLFKESKKNS